MSASIDMDLTPEQTRALRRLAREVFEGRVALPDTGADEMARLVGAVLCGLTLVPEDWQRAIVAEGLRLLEGPRLRAASPDAAPVAVRPGDPTPGGALRSVEIGTPADLEAEIRWCARHGGAFVFTLHFDQPGYYLLHDDYPEGGRMVKTVLVRALLAAGRLRTADTRRDHKGYVLND